MFSDAIICYVENSVYRKSTELSRERDSTVTIIKQLAYLKDLVVFVL